MNTELVTHTTDITRHELGESSRLKGKEVVQQDSEFLGNNLVLDQEGMQKGDLFLIEEIEEGELEQGNVKAFECVQANLTGEVDEVGKEPWVEAVSFGMRQDELVSVVPLTLDNYQDARNLEVGELQDVYDEDLEAQAGNHVGGVSPDEVLKSLSDSEGRHDLVHLQKTWDVNSDNERPRESSERDLVAKKRSSNRVKSRPSKLDL